MSALRTVRSPGPGADPTAPTVLLLHGFGSDEHDLAGLAPHLPSGLPWAALRAPLDLPHGGAAWFPITTPGTPDPAPVAAAADAIWAWVDAELGPDATVAPLGFSQGGLMASELLRTRPGRVVATVVLGGFVAGGERPGDATLAGTRPPVFWGRGELDTVIAPHAIERTAAWLPAHSTLTARTYPGLAHGIDAAELADVRASLTTHVAG
ncbi:alpha/beta hydrolase [Cellulomonas iranensis]|uniref:alpha/beta hydrolase n=1 Tax=Cellulomonas iranensis TaxID=76862 RepID=UPI0013D200DC|nr:esterase [Cellulomonas iranensis]